MSKYGKPLRFGYSPLPMSADPMRPLQLAGMAETFGLDYVGIHASLYSAQDYELWTLLTAIGIATKSISIFALMPETALYSPALWAKAVASLDLLTNGRVEAGIGLGKGIDPLAMMGNERRSETETLAALEEAIQVMRLMWSSDSSVQFDGKFWQLAEVQPGPAPSRRINIWLGASEPQVMGLVGRGADGWVPTLYPAIQMSDLEELNQQLDGALTAAGRDLSDVQRVWPIAGTISDTESHMPFEGTVQQWAESLAKLSLDVGIDTFLLVEGANAEAQLEFFALEVVPLTRQLLEAGNGAPIASGIARAIQGAGASGATLAEEATDNIDWVDETSMGSFPASDPPGSTDFT
jgi:alkanesulfonate monooxygenase SsuD/methylene tetrahydromethanopterin reductase-like flavin-dependent oxidoreductase (luciferase family)